MKFRFKPADFWGAYNTAEDMAIIANRLLDEHVVRLPEVYNHRGSGQGWSTQPEPDDTHRARLWDMHEIKPKECEHEPEAVYTFGGGSVHIASPCVKCGKRLVAEWKEQK